MRKTQITVYLDDKQTDALDLRAQAAGLSRSAYVVRLIQADQLAPGGDWNGLAARLEQQSLFVAYGLRELLRRQVPHGEAEAEARLDAAFWPGALKELFGEDKP